MWHVSTVGRQVPAQVSQVCSQVARQLPPQDGSQVPRQLTQVFSQVKPGQDAQVASHVPPALMPPVFVQPGSQVARPQV